MKFMTFNRMKTGVNVGTDHDTAEFVIETIKKWWKKMGSLSYKNPDGLLMTADGGGSNRRSRIK